MYLIVEFFNSTCIILLVYGVLSVHSCCIPLNSDHFFFSLFRLIIIIIITELCLISLLVYINTYTLSNICCYFCFFSFFVLFFSFMMSVCAITSKYSTVCCMYYLPCVLTVFECICIAQRVHFYIVCREATSTLHIGV